MTATTLRRDIKKAVDRLPPERLSSLADFVALLDRPPLVQRILDGEKAIKAGKGVDWRKVVIAH